MRSMATGPRRHALVALTACLSLLVACAAPRPASDSAPRSGTPSRLPGDAVPREEPRSRYGNGPVYEVFGEKYRVMNTSYGYRERGVASWYGKKFHGRLTSSREPYDMYAMTAAHKTLPLPTYVRVTNLKNGKSIIVRVNDRGPFVHNRLIDLSYSAALRLDMVTDGTSLVEVEAISYDAPPAARTQVASATPKPAPQRDSGVFVQVGAFGDASNARRRYRQLRESGIGHAFVQEDRSSSPPLFRVRIGPIANVAEYDNLVARLGRLGITETHLVTD